MTRRGSGRAMRVLAFVAAMAPAWAAPILAQMPSAIRKPIAAARRSAAKMDKSIEQEQKAADDAGSTSAMPAATGTPAAASPDAKGPELGANGGTLDPAEAARSQARFAAAASTQKGPVTFYRETFSYDQGGRRDPFLSLMATGQLRPMISDLSLLGVIYDESGRNSVAILADASSGGQAYRRKTGEQLGRVKVVRISANSVTLSVDEFGFARQETLLIERTPRTSARRPQ